MASSTKHIRINDDEGFEEDLANFLGESYSTDEEGHHSHGEDDSKSLSSKTVQMKAEVGMASNFWKNPDLPEKFPLDHINVENLVNMLSKIHLVWPENLPYYDELEYSMDPERAKFPVSYYHNTDKEKVVLWHAENFRRQFMNKFPDRRPPVIAPRNECGCQKIFPTYINPTALGYPEFLDCVTTVAFLKDFFSPDILSPPTKFPERIRSHQTVIKKRKANAFEMAVIIVSLLRGSGYDAYVVDGFASKTLCTIDTTGDYAEPEERPILDYEIEPDRDSNEKKGFGLDGLGGLGFDYGYFQEAEEEAPLVPVSPSKYRFHRRGLDENNSVMEAALAPFSEDIFAISPTPSQKKNSLQQPITPENVEPEPPPETPDEGTMAAITESGVMSPEEEESVEEIIEVLADDDKAEEGDDGEGEGGEDEGEQGEGEEEGTLEEEEEEEEEQIEEEVFEELSASVKDRYHGKRTHAWILVLAGTREIDESFFLEPFSGTWRPLKDPNFLSVEAVFNEKNYWMNIQPMVRNLKLLNWDLGNSTTWSKLLVESDRKKKKKKMEGGAGDSAFQDDDEEDTPTTKPGDLFLTMPVSWMAELDISQEDYDRKYPDGSKMIEYNDAIVEVAAPYANPDGLVRKVLKFSGQSRDPEDLEYIEESFLHRKDKLIKRKWMREGKMLHEYFAKGRKDALKEHVHVSGRNRPDYPRDLYYYANAHPRGIAHRQIIKKGMIEHFEGRDDQLYFKTTLYGGIICSTIPTKDDLKKGKAREIMELVKGIGGGGSSRRGARRKIIKISEKYNRSEEKEAKDDIAEKHMLIDDGRLRILFHYQKGNLTRNTLEFYKVNKPGQSKYAPVEFKPEDCIEYHANRDEEPMNVYKKFNLLQQLDRDERSSSVLSREAEDEVHHTVTSRVQEDWRHEIEPDAFAGDRNEEYLKMMREQQPDDENAGEGDLSGADFTTPFFEKYGVPKGKREEILMKKRIMLHEKVKIMRRAYMIKELYDKEAATLREKQEWYMRHADQMNPTQEEDFTHMYKERLFQMHILEQRMVRHQQETPRLYYNLLVHLLRHPQLNRFTNKKVPPPPAPEKGLTEEERARIAKELAKLKDCCQFFNVRFSEKKGKKKKSEVVVDPNAEEEARREKCRQFRNRRLTESSDQRDDETILTTTAPGETDVANL